jgi:hypothetical protein
MNASLCVEFTLESLLLEIIDKWLLCDIAICSAVSVLE